MTKKIVDFVKNHKKVALLTGGIVLLTLIGTILVLVLAGGSGKLAFSDKMIKECKVNEMYDVSPYVLNPKGKTLKLTATYKGDNGDEQQWMVAGMSFKPTKVGKTYVKVVADDGETIETTIQVNEAAPKLIETREASFDLGETIVLADLMKYVEYKSISVPDFKVFSVVYGPDTIDISNETEYTFKEIGSYAFFVEISNPSGSAKGTIVAKVMPKLTENEKEDLTNNIRLSSCTNLTATTDKEFHAENSDWSWKAVANPDNTWSGGNNGGYYLNSFIIDFGQEIDISKYYFMMDIFANKNTFGMAVHYVDSAGKVSPNPMGFHDILGEWTQVSSYGKDMEGLYTGIYIMVLHSKDDGNYDTSDVTVWFDNLQLYQYPDPNAPIIVGGATEYEITSSKVTWNSRLQVTPDSANYVQFNKKYTNQTMTFTTKINDAKNPNLILGARMDGANIVFGANTGVVLKFYDGFFEVYAPRFGNKTVGAERVSFETGKEYTFAYSVETHGEEERFYLKITDTAGKTVIDYSLGLPSGVANSAGNFVIWSPESQMTIRYSNPKTVSRKVNVNVVVPEDGKAGTAGISAAVPNVVANAAYLAFKGDYTNEQLEFTTMIQDGNNPNLVIGARMKGRASDPGTYEGLTIRIYNEFFEVYAPTYGKIIGAENLYLKSGVSYTFKLNIEGDTLKFVVEQAGNAILGYKLENIGDVIPDSGNFMVWSMNESTDISYKMPVYVEPVANKNKVVKSTDKAGTAKLETLEAGTRSYLAMEGNYTNETFVFKTKINDPENPNLIIGARIKNVGNSVETTEGVLIGLSNFYYAVYTPNYAEASQVGAAWYSSEGDPTTWRFETNKEYTFVVLVEVDKLYFTIKDGDTELHTAVYDLPDAVAAKGSFMVWNAEKERTITYEMPTYVEIPENKNKVVETTGTAGTAQLESVNPNLYQDASYLAMKGNYSNETFTFKTKFTNPEAPNLVIGARIPNIDGNVTTSEGVFISLSNFFYAVYAPSYADASQLGAAWYSSEGEPTAWRFEADKEYTFIVQVEDSKLSFTVKDGDTEIHSAAYVLPNTVAASGNFMVWNLDAQRTITYEMPKYVEVPVNKNIVVETTGTAGVAELKSIHVNMLEDASYLAMKGDYTDEIFTFKTKIANPEAPNVVIGARVKNIDGNVETSEGIFISLANFFYAVYAPNYTGEGQLGAAWYSSTGAPTTWRFEADKEYTFVVQVEEGKLYFTVRDGNTDIHTATYDLPNTVAVSGNFMVWNMDAQRSVSYEMPVKQQLIAETAITIPSGTRSGKVLLKPETANNLTNLGYLVTADKYAGQAFEVTTTIAEGEAPGFVLVGRANASSFDSVLNVGSAQGGNGAVMISLYSNFYEIYGPEWGANAKADNYYVGGAHLSGTYTFRIQIVNEGGNAVCKFTVIKDDAVVHNAQYDFGTSLQETGHFAVWNYSEERKLRFVVKD